MCRTSRCFRNSPKERTLATVFLWYDNIMVCGCSEQAVGEIRDRIIAIASQVAGFNVVFSEMACDISREADYVGIHFQPSSKAGPAFHPSSWRHVDKKQTKAAELKQKLEGTPLKTPREVARLTGFTLWNCMLSLKPLMSVFDSIEILKQATLHLSSKACWNKPLHENISESDLSILKEGLEDIAVNEPHSLPRKASNLRNI